MSKYNNNCTHNLLVCYTIQKIVINDFKLGYDYSGWRYKFLEVANFIYVNRFEKEWQFQEVLELLFNNKNQELWDLTHLDKTAVSLP